MGSASALPAFSPPMGWPIEHSKPVSWDRAWSDSGSSRPALNLFRAQPIISRSPLFDCGVWSLAPRSARPSFAPNAKQRIGKGGLGRAHRQAPTRQYSGLVYLSRFLHLVPAFQHSEKARTMMSIATGSKVIFSFSMKLRICDSHAQRRERWSVSQPSTPGGSCRRWITLPSFSRLNVRHATLHA